MIYTAAQLAAERRDPRRRDRRRSAHAIRDDITANLLAVEDLERDFARSS